MSNKLQNIKAVQQLLAGTHRTQTRKTFSMVDAESTAEKNKKRAVGETWIEKDPKTGIEYLWEQKEGFRVKRLAATAELFDNIRQHQAMPQYCPKCDRDMYEVERRLNEKMYRIHGFCFDCVLKMEARLRYEGKFEEYAETFMRKNVEAWIRDTRQEIEELKNQLQRDEEIVSSTGEIIKWSANDMDDLLERIDRDYEKLCDELLANYSRYSKAENG